MVTVGWYLSRCPRNKQLVQTDSQEARVARICRVMFLALKQLYQSSRNKFNFFTL